MAHQNQDALPVYTPYIGGYAPSPRETDSLPSRSQHDRKISLRLSDLHLAAMFIAGLMIGCWATTAYWSHQLALGREEVERKRSQIAWGDLQVSSACTRYQTREYMAELYNVPFGVDPIEECYKRTIEINGHQEKPTLCEDRGMCGRITGYFITKHEASCMPHWDRINYKGCDQGQRLFHSRLDGLSSDDNWRAVCETTPGMIEGVWFPGPTSCDDWGQHGKWGIWTPKGWSC